MYILSDTRSYTRRRENIARGNCRYGGSYIREAGPVGVSQWRQISADISRNLIDRYLANKKVKGSGSKGLVGNLTFIDTESDLDRLHKDPNYSFRPVKSRRLILNKIVSTGYKLETQIDDFDLDAPCNGVIGFYCNSKYIDRNTVYVKFTEEGVKITDDIRGYAIFNFYAGQNGDHSIQLLRYSNTRGNINITLKLTSLVSLESLENLPLLPDTLTLTLPDTSYLNTR